MLLSHKRFTTAASVRFSGASSKNSADTTAHGRHTSARKQPGANLCVFHGVIDALSVKRVVLSFAHLVPRDDDNKQHEHHYAEQERDDDEKLTPATRPRCHEDKR